MSAAPPTTSAPVHLASGAISEEHFSLEHLEQHARRLGSELHVVAHAGRAGEFLARVLDNAEALRRSHRVIAESVAAGESAASDAEWLLDNFSIVEEQLREIQEDLPRGFYRELPKLADGRPRIYRLSLELLAHTNSALDEETLLRFLNAFQEVSPLSIGETWAFPIMLRLALVENLRRIAGQMVDSRQCRRAAAAAIEKATGPDHVQIDVEALEDCAPTLLELLEQLEELGGEGAVQLKELERRLTKRGWEPNEIVRIAHRRQASNQVMIGNVITGMRLISALDWMAFFEQTNLAEQELRRDPAQTYAQMELATRDRYRRELERLAKRSGHNDREVARRATAQARGAGERQAPFVEQHVGYYLIGDGRAAFQSSLHYRPTAHERFTSLIYAWPTAFYLGGIGLATAVLLAILVAAVLLFGGSAATAAIMAALALLPAAEIAVGVVNLIVTSVLPPKLLPKLEFKDGVPATHAALVVVPSMLTSEKEIESLINRLELHYLSNPEPALRFALLTDFVDADQPTTPVDEPLIARATAEIQRLNERYAPQGGGPFYLLHRRRQWNANEGRWMGWERKRGKLMELNRKLCGEATSYDTVVGDEAALAPQEGKPAFRFIITLDADTQLPPGAARRMIGALAHPLNRPQFDGDRLKSGYILLQPRVGITLGSANRSWYARLFANSPGIDPYATAASDVYQDLFGEGSFTGKGIYDLAAFERALDGVFPENHILSHDLIEGCHTRVGLVSDIEVIDGFPTRYDAEVKRQHRWARGDWQLLPWLLPWSPGERGWIANRLSLLSKWKVIDNLRRSLLAPAMVLFLVVGWLAFPQLALLWSGAALGVLAFPFLSQVFNTIRHWPRDKGWAEYRQGWSDELVRSFVQTALQFMLLPHRAISMLDAAVRTLWRLLISRKRMLEWETAAAAEQRLSGASWFSLPLLWFAPALGLTLLFVTPAAALPAAALWIAAWIAAPLAAHWLNQPCLSRDTALDDEQRRYLRLAARRTWSYFERYVTAEGNWLPPDNVQEHPSEKIAHRVSPTNEGLFLLSALSAREFGYLPLQGLVELWEKNLASWMKFDRLHGHFFNWYESTELRALHPRYLSTVDSGNLAVSFLTMKVGIDALRQQELFTPAQWQGVLDTVAVLEDACRKLQPRGARIVSPPLDNLVEATAAIGACNDPPQTLNEWRLRLKAARAQAEQLSVRTDEFVASRTFPWTDVPALARGLVNLVNGLAADFDTLFAWFEPVAGHGVSPEAPLTTMEAPWALAESERATWTSLLKKLNAARTLRELAALHERTAGELQQLHIAWQSSEHTAEADEWLTRLRTSLSRSSFAACELDDRLERIATRVEQTALEMNFTFLYNPQRRLFSIGFNVEDGQLDRSHYDMLASEVRLASYFAIAKGDVDHRTWFRMGRGLIRAAGQVGVISWGGTMFEYLMPQLFHREYEGSLIAASVRMAVARQREHGRNSGVPWGISESAFSALAGNSDYHYKSFGVPGLGLKRGLDKDLVISPYSTFLALEVEPQHAVANLHALEKEGALGTWGFYEAIDYTPERMPSDRRSLIVRCFMAHHLGMSMLALANVLQDGVIRRRFHSHPLGRAGELLLQERVPIAAPLVQPPDGATLNEHIPRNETDLVSRRLIGYDSPAPRTHLLSNGHYAVMVTGAGGGYSKHHDVALTRWRSDATCDAWGQFIYLRDVTSGRVWSATYQPTRAKPDAYQVTYSIDKAEFHRRDGNLETHLEIAVSPEHQAEVRHLKLTNHGAKPMELELTSYAEVVLCPANADAAHPAFQKLFVETEYLPHANALLARRRPRDARETAPFAAHILAAGAGAGNNTKVEFESSREQFLGRGGTLANPAALSVDTRLSGSVGAVLDPIFSLRCRVVVPPYESAAVAFTTVFANSREEAVTLAETYHELRGVLRAFEMAWAFNQVALRHLHLSPAKAHLFQRLAAALLYPDPSRRAEPKTLLANRLGQSGLWKYGISGDNPILLLHVTKPEQAEIVRDLLTAHRYWREHRFLVDLVILNDNPGSYIDALQEQLVGLVNEAYHQPQQGSTNVALLRGAQIPREDHVLLESAASVVLHGGRGSLQKQLEPPPRVVPETPLKPTKPVVVVKPPAPPPRPPALTVPVIPNPSGNGDTKSLLFANGLGGFSPDGKEYRFVVREGQRPLKPWTNVLANPRFGCLITDSGGGYTWAENSREFKLTTWANDPLLDTPAEWLYLRCEKTGEILRPLPQRVRAGEEYHVAHGMGYSRFEVELPGLALETNVAVAVEYPVKFVRVTVSNRGKETRRFSLTYLAEWVLGVNREQTQLHVTTAWDETAAALLATNPYHPELAQQVAFLSVVAGETSWCGDRDEFIGRNGDPAEPVALKQPKLSGTTGPGLDPCGALQTIFAVAPGERWSVTFLLGAGNSVEEVQQLIAKYRQPNAVDDALKQVAEQWGARLGALQVRTPNAALDLLVNHWLLYQTIACRLWARAALYQAGGAFGFRDQLQDVMAVVYSSPELARAQLLRAAARQFEEGDVQHWWHPPLGRGTRTRFSDDYLWLPLVTCHYLQTTGDRGVLDETASFLRSDRLEPHEHERYELPAVSPEKASLYEHCRRTVARAFHLGPHGLPLIGCGDWNDGMNKIGELGQGESVWVGWFLLVILRDFLPVMRERGDHAEADELAAKAATLRHAIEANAWDGEWYRRAFFDDGTPLGSSQNDECQIDSIAQTWAVFAGAPEERTRRAMQVVSERLIRRRGKLVLLFAPAFDKTKLDPGYIKGYLPGIRENGGQYTHPALWVIQAFAQLGDADKALEVFDLINPIHHAATAADCEVYQVEPYVVAADVYGVQPHVGRGGWTWYTGSAAWMYRTAVETLLGFQLRGDKLTISPRVPKDWPKFEIDWRWNGTLYRIVVNQPGETASAKQVTLDGRPLENGEIPLVADGGTHEVVVGKASGGRKPSEDSLIVDFPV